MKAILKYNINQDIQDKPSDKIYFCGFNNNCKNFGCMFAEKSKAILFTISTLKLFLKKIPPEQRKYFEIIIN